MTVLSESSNPILTKWHMKDNGTTYSVQVLNEQVDVINHCAVLQGLPDRKFRVFIDGMYEIDINDKLTSAEQFKVDYSSSGSVFFHKDFNKETVNISQYYSKGIVYLPASRIWTKIDNLGNVIQTLDGVIDSIESIDDLETTVNGMLETAKEIESHTTNTIDDAHKTMEDLDSKHSISTAKLRELDLAIKSSQTEREKIQKQVDEMGEIVKQTEHAVNEANQAVESLETIKNEVSTIEEDLIAVADKGQSMLDEINSNFDEAEKWKNELDDIINSTTEAVNNVDVANKRAKETADYLDSTIESGVKINNNMENAIDKGQNTIKELNDVLNGIDINLELIQETTQKAQEVNKELSIQLNEVNQVKPQLQQLVDKAQELVDDLLEVIENTELESVIEKLQKLEEMSHKHINMSTLDKLTERTGSLMYDGKPVGSVTSVNSKTGDVKITKEDVGLDNVENLSANNIVTQDRITKALGYTPENINMKGKANGYVPLSESLKIPSKFLPEVSLNEMFVVDNKDEMDKLQGVVNGDRCFVKEESSLYIRSGDKWDLLYKVNEDITLDWDSIENKPHEFTPKNHSHSQYVEKDNITTLEYKSTSGISYKSNTIVPKEYVDKEITKLKNEDLTIIRSLVQQNSSKLNMLEQKVQDLQVKVEKINQLESKIVQLESTTTALNKDKANKTTRISAGTGLTGGGTLGNDISLGVHFGTTSTTVARGNHTHSDLGGKPPTNMGMTELRNIGTSTKTINISYSKEHRYAILFPSVELDTRDDISGALLSGDIYIADLTRDRSLAGGAASSGGDYSIYGEPYFSESSYSDIKMFYGLRKANLTASITRYSSRNELTIRVSSERETVSNWSLGWVLI